jgi:prevent-host-death family protein
LEGFAVATFQGSNTVGAYDAKTHFSELLERAEAGDEITITKHGTPVAKLVPVKKVAPAEERAAAIQRIQKLASGLSLGGLRVKDLIREGRR